MYRLVAIILTKNEAHNITACIASLRDWTDAVIVWDSLSTDQTVQAAQEAGALVVQRPFDTYAAQRQAALDTIAADWVLFVDADERATPALAREIRRVVANASSASNNSSPVGFGIPRRNFIVGRAIRSGGFFPDYQMRLLRRDAARYDPRRAVHEVVELNGPTAHVIEPLLHYNYTSWRQFHDKQRAYAAYEAQILAARGIRPRPHNFVLQPLREFWRRFVTLHGWRDGWPGLRLALLLAWYYGFVPYWHLLSSSNHR